MSTGNVTWCVIEDNGGGLHLYVFDKYHDEVCIYAGSGYEHNPDALRCDIAALRAGDDALGWDIQPDVNPQLEWDAWDIRDIPNGGWDVVCNHVWQAPKEKMGSAARSAFYDCEK